MTSPESFEDFKNSFSYGSRTDLNFKFLAKLSDDTAAAFFQELLWKLGDAFDDNDWMRIVAHIYEWQIRAYSGGKKNFTYTEGPFTPLDKPLSKSRAGLITSSGHFVDGQDPEPFGVKDMTQQKAIERIGEFVKEAPALSSIPMETPMSKLRVRHGGYDIRSARVDPNVTFPSERLLELEQEGIIGKLAPLAYSFVGACSQKRLLTQTGPQWVETFKQQQIDVALLVPV